MKYFKLDKNLVITFVICYTSQFTIPLIHSVYNGRESGFFLRIQKSN